MLFEGTPKNDATAVYWEPGDKAPAGPERAD
jgi:hypothetical protein